MKLIREFSAPRERVYAALTDPELGRQWWAPEGFRITELVLDATPGGYFGFVMENEKSGDSFASRGVYKEAVQNKRLVWTSTNVQGDGLGPETRATVELEDAEGGTRLELTHEGFPDSATRDDHAGGWSACLDQLDRILR